MLRDIFYYKSGFILRVTSVTSNAIGTPNIQIRDIWLPVILR